LKSYRSESIYFFKEENFFSHKDLEKCIDDYENGIPIFLYTGRDPSFGIHLNHMIPFTMAVYLRKASNATCIIQLSDDEKYYFKNNELEYFHNLSRENAKDIIACGFDKNKTFIFSNLNTVGGDYYKVIVQIMKKTTGNQIRSIYGLNLNNNIGKISWPCFQIAPTFSQSFPKLLGNTPIRCLVVMAIDQIPFFRMAQDFGEKMESYGFIKPAEIHAKFLVGLSGINNKEFFRTKYKRLYHLFIRYKKTDV
jgi:tryptophanyl-tRNA synthetase